MQYNFDQIHDRKKNESIKWDFLGPVFEAPDAIPLWVADMDFKAAPEIIEALEQRVQQGIYGYTALNDDYFDAFIYWCSKRHQIDVKREELIFSPGVVPGLIMSIHALTQPGDKVIIQPPVYGPFKRSVIDHGREVVYNPLKLENGYYTMDFELLDKQMAEAKLFILCNPHNPVGRVWTEEELKQLAKLAIKHQVKVISDEIHSDLILKGHQHIPFVSVAEELSPLVVTCMAPTKTFNLAGLQTSVLMIKNPQMHETIQGHFERMDLKVNNCFGQVAFKAAYNKGEPWLEALLQYIEGNMDYVVDYIGRHIPEIKVSKPEGTYLLWMDCRALGFNHKDLMTFMLKHAKLALTEGDFFGEEGQGFMRMNLACPRAVLEKAMAQLDIAVKHLRL